MAKQIRRELVLGNFRTPKSAQVKRRSTWRQKRPGMSDGHLKLIRKLPCLACLKVPAGTVHHLKDVPGRERGMAIRATDRWGVPMCIHCHELIERAGSRNERQWFVEHAAVDVVLVAMSLWGATGDVSRMLRVLIAHKGGA